MMSLNQSGSQTGGTVMMNIIRQLPGNRSLNLNGNFEKVNL